jgi:hypothetical protein
MPDDSLPNEPLCKLPSSFFEVIIKDIPAMTWERILKNNPTLRAVVLEGFSVPAKKLGRLLQQPQIVTRLQRCLRSEKAILNEILNIWGQEQLSIMAFLEMLDRDFLLDNSQSLKNFIGPERFLAGLKLLGPLSEAEYESLVGDEFWERHLDSELVGPLIPFWDLWNGFVQKFPQANAWLRDSGLIRKGELEEDRQETRPSSGKPLRALEERCSKLQMKLDKAEEEKSHLQQELNRYRKEQDELRTRIAEHEKTHAQELREALASMRLEWFRRYQAVDVSSLSEADGLLESLLQRTEQAFALQRRADEEYGLTAAVRQKLLHVDSYLKEIERIYAESLVVHSEVTRAKEALLQAKARLLKLPGIQKALKPDPLSFTGTDMCQQIRLLDALPENLSRVTELRTLVPRLADLGLIGDPQAIMEDIEHKRRQIMENLYAEHQLLQEQSPRGRHFENLEDFVKSRESTRYDLYVDGYNILLKLHGKHRTSSPLPLTAVRDQFIEAVVRKSRLFRRVHLVFDGQEDSRDRQGNADIIYTDKSRGNTADAYIIEAVRKRKDRLVLLATGDQEIIRAIEDRLYALVDPYHFYLFVYDMPFPDLV